jgi:hypothetical protein
MHLSLVTVAVCCWVGLPWCTHCLLPYERVVYEQQRDVAAAVPIQRRLQLKAVAFACS